MFERSNSNVGVQFASCKKCMDNLYSVEYSLIVSLCSQIVNQGNCIIKVTEVRLTSWNGNTNRHDKNKFWRRKNWRPRKNWIRAMFSLRKNSIIFINLFGLNSDYANIGSSNLSSLLCQKLILKSTDIHNICIEQCDCTSTQEKLF